MEIFICVCLITIILLLIRRKHLGFYELQGLRSQICIQGNNGNWNYDPYMHGFFNGLECALATIENREPLYRDAPKEWLADQPKAPLEVENVR